MSEKTLKEHEQYHISQSGQDLLFTWKFVAGLSIEDMAKGIVDFANYCNTHKPKRALIDARQLDPICPALGWVSGQQSFPDQEEYMHWWQREVLPLYNSAGIVSLAVATGNPNAPGAIAENPPGVNFKMGYFNELDDASHWDI